MTSPVPCGIRNIDLREPLTELSAAEDERSVLAYFWQDEVPLGRRLFLESELPVPVSALAAVVAVSCAPALSEIEAEVEISEKSFLTAADVTVIVCTRNRAEQLHGCISALIKCEPAPGEILVVDNSDTAGSLEPVLQEFRGIRVLHESRKGLSFARNTGMAAASGKIISFTDDDVTVSKNWVESLAKYFIDPEVGAVTGPVLPVSLESKAEFAFEFDLGGLASSLVPSSFDKKFLDTGFFKAPFVWDVGAGANFSIRKKVLDDIEYFDERLGAGAAGCSEDSEFIYRLLGADWTCLYRPEVVVHHNHRGNDVELRRQMRAYMKGHVAALFVQFKQSGHIGNLTRVFFGLPRYFLGWLVVSIFRLTGFRWLESWSPSARATRIPQVLGSIEGLFYLLQNRSVPKHSAKELESD